MTQKTKAAASRKAASAPTRTHAAKAKDTRTPPFAEYDFQREESAAQVGESNDSVAVEEPSREAQAKSALIAILQAIPEKNYRHALDALYEHWWSGMDAGYAKGIKEGWEEGCALSGKYKAWPGFRLSPRECTPPNWPDAAHLCGVFELVICLLSQQAGPCERSEQGNSNLAELQWDALNRIYGDAYAQGEARGKKFGASMCGMYESSEMSCSA